MRASGTFVGRIGLFNPEGWPGLECIWALARGAWGKGYATEGARRALEYAFTELDQAHVISLIRPGNTASIRVAERLGETLEGARRSSAPRQSCTVSRESTREHLDREDTMRLTVADAISPSYFVAIAAVELGFFRQEGVDMEFVFAPPNPSQALKDGTVDFFGGSPFTGLRAFRGWRGGALLCALATTITGSWRSAPTSNASGETSAR